MDFNQVAAVQPGDSCVLERLGPDNPQRTSVVQAYGLGSLWGDTGQDCPVGSVPQSQPHSRLAESRA